MKTPQEIVDMLYHKGAEAGMKIRELEELGKEFVEAEKQYHIALSAKMLELKADNAISTCEKLAKGDPLVAERKKDMEIKAVIMDACKRSLGLINTKIDILRSDLSYKKEEVKNIGYTQET